MIELEPYLPKILEIEYSAYPRKWSTSFTNMEDASLFSQQNEPPEDIEPTQDMFGAHEDEEIEYSLPQIYEDDILEK
jgi:hypothetical protein